MKNLILSLLIGLSLFATPAFSTSCVNTYFSDKKEVTVYTTKTGNKYHTGTCRYLSRSKIETTKKAAISGGYGACSICKP
ncbi:hypothetical protein IWX76_002434 [Pedobacter sp. CAN_A7]|uniref:hypothetical protein n=1 Tax=Pedobacter sp. CAN_A7 TaxID=2787722 RepID=UPI0018C9A0FA